MSCGRIGSNINFRHIQCGNTSRAIFSRCWHLCTINRYPTYAPSFNLMIHLFSPFSRHLTISNRLKTNGKAKLVTMTSSIHLPIINPHSQKKPQLVMGGALLCFCYPCLYSEVAVAEMLVQRAAQVNLKWRYWCLSHPSNINTPFKKHIRWWITLSVNSSLPKMYPWNITWEVIFMGKKSIWKTNLAASCQ